MAYVPGSLTEPKKRADGYDELVAKASETPEIEAPSSKGYPKYKDDFSRKSTPPERDLKEEAEEVYNKHKEMLNTTYNGKKHCENKKNGAPSYILDAIANFNLAKKLHTENLEHEPLPDTLTDALYRKLQMQKYEKDPGLALKESPRVTGIGWKGYPGYGPTRCTKLKVYRPKTGIPDKQGEKRDGRPNSVCSFDRKWRFIRQSKVSPIDLAIYWDLTPLDPKDEPKPPTHIDGSNGSLAPALFSLVHTPKEEDVSEKSSRKSSGGSTKSEPLFEKLPKNDTTDDALPFLNNRAKTTRSRSSVDSGESRKNRARSACDMQEVKKCESNGDLKNDEFHKSSPNLQCTNHCHQAKKLPNSRRCAACELRGVKTREKPKADYKMAFKAGVPQAQRCVSTNAKVKFLLRMPKPKDPYRKRNYFINSLAAPFSLQKDKKQCGYPEHWRLATVYQHSYKPIQSRKRPLLATVFK